MSISIKIDIDGREGVKVFAERLFWLLKFDYIRLDWVECRRSRRGYHFIVMGNFWRSKSGSLSLQGVLASFAWQAVLGSDWMREANNIIKLRDGLRIVETSNVLFEQKNGFYETKKWKWKFYDSRSIIKLKRLLEKIYKENNYED